jgi:hypothetical protein
MSKSSSKYLLHGYFTFYQRAIKTNVWPGSTFWKFQSKLNHFMQSLKPAKTSLVFSGTLSTTFIP